MKEFKEVCKECVGRYISLMRPPTCPDHKKVIVAAKVTEVDEEMHIMTYVFTNEDGEREARKGRYIAGRSVTTFTEEELDSEEWKKFIGESKDWADRENKEDG